MFCGISDRRHARFFPVKVLHSIDHVAVLMGAALSLLAGEFYQVDRLELDLEDVNPHSLHGLCLRYAVTHLDEIIDRSKMRVDTETLAVSI